MTRVLIFFIALITISIGGCAVFEKSVSTISLIAADIRSPITLKNYAFRSNDAIDPETRKLLESIASQIFTDKTPNSNLKPRRQEALEKAVGQTEPNLKKFDTLQDLCDDDAKKKTLLFVAISGGGARASALASSAMAILEKKYNIEVAALGGNQPPLFDQIAAFSTVSGGSLYAYQVAETNKLYHDQNRSKKYVFEEITEYADKPEDLGYVTGLGYPISLFGPILSFGTDINYLHLLAGGLNLQMVNNKQRLPYGSFSPIEWLAETALPASLKLSEIPPNPRFYFNATILETGLPFVFTQRIVHLPIEQLFGQSARLDVEAGLNNVRKDKNRESQETRLKILKPLAATTLEEINSSPETIPLVLAAMASAAFPPVVEPMELRKFGYRPASLPQQTIYKSEDVLHIADGGVYDNSGLSTIMETIEYMTKESSACGKQEPDGQKTKRQIAILAINADADTHDPFYPHADAEEATFWDRFFPLKLDLPIRWRSLLALDRIHFTNKRRAERMAIEKIKSLHSDMFQIYYFPISLAQLSSTDEFRLPDPSNLYPRLQAIDTNYLISKEESTLLAQAANHIINIEQPKGWCFEDHTEIKRLGEALIHSLLRGEHQNSQINECK